ncbi:MAG: hypothetical protein LBQ79_00430 [Deltaproteobacteria bacterium]|jgi:hypothetical protein|nr:hypothetical protein [Deltaproteobacteria bacterium]
MSFFYKYTPTGKLVHESDAYVKMIMGPFGSGKSTVMAMDMLYYAMAQDPDPADNIRYSRWGVIRASYPNLSSTRRTIMEVMPEHTGDITLGNAPWRGVFAFALPDGTKAHMEVELWSAQTGEDAKKFRSANWTGCWINEATEITSDVLFAGASRVGRYPSKRAGGCRWGGVLMDFNRPPRGHWLLNYFERPSLRTEAGVLKIDSFTQPPAAFRREDSEGKVTYEANPEAENLENLEGGLDYYRRQIGLLETEGKTAQIESLYCLMDADLREGKPVFPTFSRETHVSKGRLDPLYYQPVVVGVDTSGIHPAAVVVQLQNTRWCVIDELCGLEVGLDAFLDSLTSLLSSRYRRCETITVSCDPANARDSYTGLSPATHFQNAGFDVTLPRTNNPDTRISAVASLLNRTYGGLMVSSHCEQLVAALAGDYHYKRHRILGTVQAAYSSRPEKNEASHVADALQYAAMEINRDSGTPDMSRAIEAVNRANALRGRIMVGA